MSDYKKIPGRQIKPGDKFSGWSFEGCSRFANGVVKEVNPFQITAVIFPGRNQTEEVIDINAMFEVPMSKEEYKEKYREQAREVVKGLKNHLSLDEIGYHEMDNHWIVCSPYGIADALQEMGCRVVGVCSDIPEKYSIMSMNSDKDIGICVEYIDNGERFWCHWFLHSVEDTIEEFENNEKRGENSVGK